MLKMKIMIKLVHPSHIGIHISNAAVTNYEIVIFFKLMPQPPTTTLKFKKITIPQSLTKSLTPVFTFLESSRTSIPKMPSPHFFPNLIPIDELLRESKAIIQTSRRSFLLRFPFQCHGHLLPLPSSQHYALSETTTKTTSLKNFHGVELTLCTVGNFLEKR